MVEAELKCDQEPSTIDVANAFIKRCQSTSLIVTATPKGSKGSLERGDRGAAAQRRRNTSRTKATEEDGEEERKESSSRVRRSHFG